MHRLLPGTAILGWVLLVLLGAGCGASEPADVSEAASSPAPAPAPLASEPAPPSGPVQLAGECGMPMVADGDRFLEKQDAEGTVLATYVLEAPSDALQAELEEAFALALEAGRQLCVDGTHHPFEGYVEISRAVVGPH